MPAPTLLDILISVLLQALACEWQDASVGQSITVTPVFSQNKPSLASKECLATPQPMFFFQLLHSPMRHFASRSWILAIVIQVTHVHGGAAPEPGAAVDLATVYS